MEERPPKVPYHWQLAGPLLDPYLRTMVRRPAIFAPPCGRHQSESIWTVTLGPRRSLGRRTQDATVSVTGSNLSTRFKTGPGTPLPRGFILPLPDSDWSKTMLTGAAQFLPLDYRSEKPTKLGMNKHTQGSFPCYRADIPEQ